MLQNKFGLGSSSSKLIQENLIKYLNDFIFINEKKNITSTIIQHNKWMLDYCEQRSQSIQTDMLMMFWEWFPSSLAPPPALTAHLLMKSSSLTCGAHPLMSYCPDSPYIQGWALQVHICPQSHCSQHNSRRCRRTGPRSLELSCISEVCSGRAPPTWLRSLWSSKVLQARCSLSLR